MIRNLDRLGRGIVFVSVLVVVLLVGTAAAQSAPDCSTVSYNGDGSSINPFEVSNVDQLQCIEDQGLNFNYEVVSDIDASETALWNEGFGPIGENPAFGTSFNGTFDGAGHTITGLNIDPENPVRNDVGIFGAVGPPGEVRNVSVKQVDIIGQFRVGGLVAFNAGGIVRDSSASGEVIGSSNNVGGLVGVNAGGIVRDSSASADVTGSFNNVGGFIGLNKEGIVRGSSASGNVEGNEEVGGLVGRNIFGGRIRNSSASGEVTGDVNVGGFVGENSEGTVEMSSSTGNATGNESVGGLVGFNVGGTVEDSYARGDVDGFVSDVGGLVGENGASGDPGTVRRSYATGEVTGPVILPGPGPGPIQNPIFLGGGLVGNNTAGTITDSYWDVNTTGFGVSDGGTGLTTDEMNGSDAASNMQGFDFSNTWETVTSPDDYPLLAWEGQADGGNCPFDPVVCTYDPNGDIGTGELQQAINDFIQQNIDTGDLQAVINAFIQSQSP